jgi:hypothetical protein
MMHRQPTLVPTSDNRNPQTTWVHAGLPYGQLLLLRVLMFVFLRIVPKPNLERTDLGAVRPHAISCA